MSNFNTLIPARKSRVTGSRWVILFLLTLGLSTGWKPAQANAPENAPPQVKTLLTQIDASANRGNVKGVMNFYSPSFVHGDGLNRLSMEKSLTSLWKRYPSLKYSTKLQSWSTQGNTIIADTVTNIVGLPAANNNKLGMNATIKSRQRIVNGKIVRQDILSERTQLTSGVNPPKVDINLPDKLKVGENYYFDAIINEPLGDDFLLGAALDEAVQPGKYLNPTSVDLELLTAGGIFKVGRAPAKPGNQWISAVLVRGNGITMITQRVPVVGK
ncbi:nuclear transport factor 2 family protein [Rivularia sp. UHCC 0363]|uniref:nuclear transport factor 2 family protein n=1 Tax=Rivularia sp. UHCC 0363 TaxID=3110244 RepID=UPI002B20256E|nr:nuclear transport factor 2 family protein [Rivularia sp. UHCC 0363]MEA5596792.1 nuclear transport factor 2 family protein [Rivularia sp. UHCC 0363]